MHVRTLHSGSYVAQNGACYHWQQLTSCQACNNAYKLELKLNCVILLELLHPQFEYTQLQHNAQQIA